MLSCAVLFGRLISALACPEVIVPEIKLDSFREIIMGNYRVIYKIDEKQISVLTVRASWQLLPVDEVIA